jgi:general secretion pathway protein L
VARLQTLRELLVPLNSAGVSVARIVPDCLALPFAPGRWSLLGEDGRVLVRCGTQLGFAVESELLDPLLARLDPAGYPAALDLYGDVPVPDAFAAVPRTRHPLPQGNLVCLAGGATLGSALDLMPDSFRPLRKRRGVWLGAALLVAALAAHLGMLWRDNAHLAAAVSAVRAEQQKVMQAAFPAITRVVNAELQATQAVAELREQAGNGPAALEMLHAAGRLLQSEGSGKFTLESVNYADGVLNLRLRGADVESIERYSAALKSTLAVEVVAVESQPDGTVASLRLQAPQKSAP